MPHLGSPLTLQSYEQKASLSTINFIWLNVNAGHARTTRVWPIPLEHTLCTSSRARAAINTLHYTQDLPALTVNVQEDNII